MAALLALAGCVNGQFAVPDAGSGAPVAPAPAAPMVQSQSSKDLELYYLRVQNDLLARGLLRVDGGGPDVPYTARNLAENFAAIALSEELRVENGRVLPGKPLITLRRWRGPIRFGIHFGDTVPEDIRVSDRAFIEAYVKRLARITGHPMSLASNNTNFDIVILHEDQRLAVNPLLQRAGVTPSRGMIDAIAGMSRNDYCAVLTEDRKNDGVISNALAIVRAEHSEMMRRMCFHEEIAQGLGLFNDSPRARPSIFNDDEEFGRLTTHDEMLLRILYDPRMRPGMSAAEAEAMAVVIANELVGGES
ncbi:MAG: DUF2927 domain-containing protein [Paracoccaceae bacterium]